jgi:hypothetical protein
MTGGFMRRILIVGIIWLFSAAVGWAQQQSGELQGFYQRINSFDMKYGGGPTPYDIKGQAFNGLGYGFVFNISDKFGLYQQMGFFFSGVGQGGIDIKLITEFQGMQLTKTKGRVDLFARGGVGFSRYVFNRNSVFYSMAFQYGGGIEIQLKQGIFMLIEVTGISMGVPDVTGYDFPDRTKWNTSLVIGPGIAIHF